MPAEVENMMYVGQVPWHGLGKKVDGLQTAKEAIMAAGMDWKVKKIALKDIDGNDVPNHYSIRREDNKKSLGVVGNNYTPLQNSEAFSFNDAVIQEKAAVYSTAGVLFEGRKIWLLSKIDGVMKIGKNDIIDKYLLLTNGHDGLNSLQIALTTVRVVCNNTLQQALNSAAKNELVKIRHTQNMGNKVTDVRTALGLVNKQFESLKEKIDLLASTQVTTANFDKFVETLGFTTQAKEGEIKKKEEYNALVNAFENAPGQNLSTAKGTLWGAVNAVTYYVDHVQNYRTVKNSSSEAESKLNSIFFTSGNSLKQEAFNTALAMAK